MKCYALTPNTRNFVAIPDDLQWQAAYSTELKQLRFMMACDVGWSGMMFKSGELSIVICESWDHVVDVRSLNINIDAFHQREDRVNG